MESKAKIQTILTLIVLLLVVCIFLIITYGLSPLLQTLTASQPAQAAALMPSGLPTATLAMISETPIPPPTADFPRMTAEARIARETDLARNAELTIAAAVVVSATMQQAAINAAATSVSLTQTSAAATSTAQPPASTATAEFQKTQLALVHLAATQTFEAPTQQWAAAKAAKAGEIIAADIVFKAAVSVFLLAAVIYVGLLLWANRHATPKPAEDADVEDEPVPTGYQRPLVIQTTSTDNGAIVVNADDWTGIVTQQQLLAVARGVILDRITLAIRHWYGKDGAGKERPFTRSQFEAFLKAIAVDGIGPEKKKLGVMLQNGAVVLNDYGRKYLAEVLKVIDEPSPTA
jgi:hypothetical protein